MADTNYEGWTRFYSEFADVLKGYKNRQGEIVAGIKRAFEAQGVRLPRLDSGELTEIDPFTVFCLFNKGITDDTRRKIITGLKEEFGVGEPVPDVFDGVPVLNNLSATFYLFKPNRGENDIPNLWEVFDSAIAYADEQSETNRKRFIAAYDEARKINRVKWNLTMALFWARPFFFLSLDSRNRWFVTDKEGLDDECAAAIASMKNNLPNAEAYLRIRELADVCLKSDEHAYSNFPEFSFEAWKVSEEENERQRAEKKAEEEAGKASIGDDPEIEGVRYWIVSPGAEASRWEEFYDEGVVGVGWSRIGSVEQFDTRDKLRAALVQAFPKEGAHRDSSLALWQFCHEMKPGDVIFAKKGRKEIIGRGIIADDYEFDEDRGNGYKNLRKVDWTHKGTWAYPGVAPMKTLTDMTPYTEIVQKLEALFEIEDMPEVPSEDLPPYSKEDFLKEVYLTEREYDRLSSLLRVKKNVILQGAPGVGKTFMAKRLAYSIMGCKDPERVKLVQFHQSYSYEDFIMGYRPSEGGFELKTGAFYDFCKRAADDPDNDYFFVIDEINRGNLSKIFGELFMLVEPDKRGVSLQLLYANEQFSVPANLYLIGMMNTADRSLAMMDYALRRRFAFYRIEPAFTSDGFRAYRDGLASESFDRLIAVVGQLNDVIAADDSLGWGFKIGHSYFCGIREATPERLAQIVDFELVPLLEEYWFDEPAKMADWSARLRNAIR